MRAKGLVAADRAKKGVAGTSDPYVVVHSTNGARAKTSVKQATINPEWDETLEINVYDAEVPLLLELWDHDLVGLNDSLGHCEARLEECLPGVPKAFNLPLSTQGHLELVLTYTRHSRICLLPITPPPSPPSPPSVGFTGGLSPPGPPTLLI